MFNVGDEIWYDGRDEWVVVDMPAKVKVIAETTELYSDDLGHAERSYLVEFQTAPADEDWIVGLQQDIRSGYLSRV